MNTPVSLDDQLYVTPPEIPSRLAVSAAVSVEPSVSMIGSVAFAGSPLPPRTRLSTYTSTVFSIDLPSAVVAVTRTVVFPPETGVIVLLPPEPPSVIELPVGVNV